MIQTQTSESYNALELPNISKEIEKPYIKPFHYEIGYDDGNLGLIMTKGEFLHFTNQIRSLCQNHKDIMGLLITGSLVQSPKASWAPAQIPIKGVAAKYYDICMEKKRKNTPHKGSDLDVWVCTKDFSKHSKSIKAEIDNKALSTLEWYASSPDASADEFNEKTKRFFSPYYKNSDLYSRSWKSENPEPWMAEGFKEEFSQALRKCSPGIEEMLQENFNGRPLDEFVEIRAYPQSTFNLKPHHAKCSFGMSREPFSYFIRDLVHTGRNCIVLYRKECDNSLIYPFKKDGFMLGEGVAQKIGWGIQKEEALYRNRFMVNSQ